MARRKDNERKWRPGKASTGLPDRRLMEQLMSQLVSQAEGQVDEDTPLNQAQELIYEAFEETSIKEKIRLARKALAISPDCADAFNILAEHASTRKEALDYYEQGVAAGERALGKEAFENDVGHFWGVLKTRPYMRAKLGFAERLWTLGRHEEAVFQLREILRLNPGDNQGVRYILVKYLLLLNRDEELGRLLEQFNEGSTYWEFTKALHRFRLEGNSPDSVHLLKKAIQSNRHVVPILLTELESLPEQSDYYSPGDASEAGYYARSSLAAWKYTKGAISWVRAQTPSKKPPEPNPRGPEVLEIQKLKTRPPQGEEVWQADFRQAHNWMRIGNEMVRVWLFVVASFDRHQVLAFETFDKAPSSFHLWDTLLMAMREPLSGRPARPTELQVRHHKEWEALKLPLGQIGITLVETSELAESDQVLDGAMEKLVGKPGPALMSIPGNNPDLVGSFFEAAAYYFRAAPWLKVGDHAIIRVECPQVEGGPWFAILLGQAGLSTGLVLYKDQEILKEIISGKTIRDHALEDLEVTSVGYGKEWEIPCPDLEAQKKYGWLVEREDGYPLAIHKVPNGRFSPPKPWELNLLTACLKTLPDFTNRQPRALTTPMEFRVPVFEGTLVLTLAWLGE